MNLRLSCISDWQRVIAYVKTLAWQRPKVDGEGKPVMADGKPVMEGIQYRIAIEELRPRRSLEQNARYWALLTEISKQAPAYMGGVWHSPEVWHTYCASRFLGMEAGPWGHGVPKSTAKLRVGQFSEYMTQIEVWAGDQFPGFTFEYEQREAA